MIDVFFVKNSNYHKRSHYLALQVDVPFSLCQQWFSFELSQPITGIIPIKDFGRSESLQLLQQSWPLIGTIPQTNRSTGWKEEWQKNHYSALQVDVGSLGHQQGLLPKKNCSTGWKEEQRNAIILLSRQMWQPWPLIGTIPIGWKEMAGHNQSYSNSEGCTQVVSWTKQKGLFSETGRR